MLKLTLYKIKTFFGDLVDIFIPPKLEANKLQAIPHEIQFKVQRDGDSTTLYTEQLPGLFIGIPRGSNPIEIINDALFVYFDIPRYWIKNIKQSATLTDKKGRIIAQEIHDTLLKYKY